MGVRSRHPHTPQRDDTPSEPNTIAQFRTRPGRYVFIERDNADGWIATDLAVDLDA